MQVVGCSSSFASGAPWTGVRGSPSACRPLARNLSPRSSLAAFVHSGEEDCSAVNYDDVATQWITADFLDLRLRSSGLICNEAIHALRNHFQKKDEHATEAAANVAASMGDQQARESRKESSPAPRVKSTSTRRPLPNVTVLDEAYFSQMYNSSSPYTTTCSFLDESFC